MCTCISRCFKMEDSTPDVYRCSALRRDIITDHKVGTVYRFVSAGVCRMKVIYDPEGLNSFLYHTNKGCTNDKI